MTIASDKRIAIDSTNRLVTLSLRSGLPVSYFETDDSKEYEFLIRIKGTRLQFRLVQSRNEFDQFECHYTECVPNFRERHEGINKNWISIERVCTVYQNWLTYHVSRYMKLVNVPDQWAEIQTIQQMIPLRKFNQEDFEMFTESEQKRIQRSLVEFQILIKHEIDPINEKIEALQEKLDYLSDSLNKLNRFDWKGVAISTLIGIATNMSVDTNTGKRVYDLFQQAFGNVIRLIAK